MLMLQFQLGDSRYAIPAREVVEVTPRVELQRIATTPAWVCGLFDYRGRHVPVIDLRLLLDDTPCRDSFTSRIILVDYPLPDGGRCILGLLAERVTETLDIDEEAFADTGLNMEQAPFLGEAARCEDGLVQRVGIADLLPAAVRSQLFPAETG